MVLPNVDYQGEHSITFIVDGVSRNTWTDWGLVPSSRHSEPINSIWNQTVAIPGVNGQEDLVRKYPYAAVNSYSKLKAALKDDNRNKIKSDSGYDIYLPSSGNLSFIIADQRVSYFQKEREILNFLHNQSGTMKFADDPSKTYTCRFSVAFSSGNDFSGLSVSYSVISET